MIFEYDPVKSSLNRDKHGIDFEEAKSLWEDEYMMRFAVECSSEKRFGCIARYGGSSWTAIYTIREDAIRIISVRRSNKKEVSLYDKAFNER